MLAVTVWLISYNTPKVKLYDVDTAELRYVHYPDINISKWFQEYDGNFIYFHTQ